MTRIAVACVLACLPLTARADDPKPDVAKLKDDVELLEAKLEVWKAKVTGAEKTIQATKDVLDRIKQAERAGAAAFGESSTAVQSNIKATTDLDVFRAEMRVAEVKLNQAKRRLAAAEKGAGVPVAKAYTVSFTNQPWAAVLDWFTTETGLINAAKIKPTGTLTLRPTGGKKYTLTEIIDLFNEALAPDFVLVRGEKSFTIIPADEKPDEALFARVDVKDLAAYGKSEIVSVLLSTGSHDPDNLLPRLKRILSPFGSIRPLGKSAVVVCDKAGNVKLIAESLELARAK
jgi:hypothetical protein